MRNFLMLTLPLALSGATELRPQSPQAHSDMPGMGAATPSSTGGTNWAAVLAAMGGINWLMDAAMPEAHLVKLDDLKPRYRTKAKRKLFRYGPYSLVAKGQPKPPLGFVSMDENGQGFFDLLSNGICEKDCTVLAGKTGLVFADGTEAGPAQGIQIHHILTSDLSKSQNQPVAFCATESSKPSLKFNGTRFSKIIGAGFIGQGEDNGEIVFTSPDGAYPSGFAIGAKDRFILLGDYVNFNNVTKDVYVTIDLEYVDGHVGKDAASTLLSVTSCQRADVKMGTATAGPAETMSHSFEIYVDGYVINAKGHMHDGADKMVLYKNGQEVCTSLPKYAPNGIGNETVLTGMSVCSEAFPVKRGDFLSMKSVYDLGKHPLPKGTSAHAAMGMAEAMGMFTLAIVEDGPKPAKKKSRIIQPY